MNEAKVSSAVDLISSHCTEFSLLSSPYSGNSSAPKGAQLQKDAGFRGKLCIIGFMSLSLQVLSDGTGPLTTVLRTRSRLFSHKLSDKRQISL